MAGIHQPSLTHLPLLPSLLQATWHCGSMLPQTVFASLYMLQPDRWVTTWAGSQTLATACRTPLGALVAGGSDQLLPKAPPSRKPASYCSLTPPICGIHPVQAVGQRTAARLLPGAALGLLSGCGHGPRRRGHRGAPTRACKMNLRLPLLRTVVIVAAERIVVAVPACLPGSILAEAAVGPLAMPANRTRTCLCTRFGVWNGNPT